MKGKVDEHDVCGEDYSPCHYSLTKQTDCVLPINGGESSDFSITQEHSPQFYYSDLKNQQQIAAPNERRRCTTEIAQLASSGTSLNSSTASDDRNDAIDHIDTSAHVNERIIQWERTAPVDVPDKNGHYYETNGMAKTKSQSTDQIEQMPMHQQLTSTSIENKSNFDLTAYVINSTDGFQEVQCYIDENGSPKVREKHAKKSRRKHTLRQELKARSLGASYDDNLMLRKPIDTNKTPSCVSFTRLFKKFRETFCKLITFFVFILAISIYSFCDHLDKFARFFY